MKAHALFRTYCYVIFLALVAFCQGDAFSQDELSQIRQAIVEKGATWTASENWLTRLPSDAQKRLCGVVSQPRDLTRAKMLSIPLISNLPSNFDWRNNNGNWTTPVKNQFPATCGSCWAFGAIAQVESWWKIHNSTPDSMIDLSEQSLLSCSGAGSCAGGDDWKALDFVKSVGVPTEACFAYQANDQVSCSQACSNWANEAVKIPGWGIITLEEAVVENVKSAVFRHPVQAAYRVYQDFPSYSHGIYKYVWGNYLGNHLILIVGWNDEEQSWICKNSWGTDWGETVNFTPHTPGAGNGGYFRIKWGECGIGSFIPFIWDEITSDPSFAYSPDRIDTALSVGDTLSQRVNLVNAGPGTLEFSSMDYQSPQVARFHSSTFHAYSGRSWWCGDSQIGGYSYYWLQYLDLPVLNLSHTSLPKLSFMGCWAMENPSSSPPPPSFDGWDGCNVWVSADGGESFDVAVPESPAYNCTSLYSFGGAGWGWNMGVGIPGWAGKSNGWSQIEFDLLPYRSDSVIIRFAFAADAGISTLDDPSLYGFLIDDITVTDAGGMLFENHGDADTAIHVHGNAGWERADWIMLTPGTGTIGPNAVLPTDLRITTKGLAAGRYYGIVVFTSNDVTYVPNYSFSGGIQINLRVQDTAATAVQEQVVEIPQHWALAQNYPNPFNASTKIGYQISDIRYLKLAVYDILGREVAVLVNEKKEPGSYTVKFNASGLSSGVYIYRLIAGSPATGSGPRAESSGFVQARTMLLLK
ncbi:MAG: C1 family peptidase [Bacteroidota bacterium]